MSFIVRIKDRNGETFVTWYRNGDFALAVDIYDGFPKSPYHKFETLAEALEARDMVAKCGNPGFKVVNLDMPAGSPK